MDKVEEWLKKVDGLLIGDPMQSLGYPEIETKGSSYELEAGRQRTDLCKKLLALVRVYREANHDIGYGYLLTSRGAISDYQVRIKYEDMCRAAEEKAKEIVG